MFVRALVHRLSSRSRISFGILRGGQIGAAGVQRRGVVPQVQIVVRDIHEQAVSGSLTIRLWSTATFWPSPTTSAVARLLRTTQPEDAGPFL